MADALKLVPVTAPSHPQPSAAPERPAAAPRKPAKPRARPESRGKAPEAASGAAWRSWGAFQATVSYKLPPELVAELDERLHQLREPHAKGLAVAAALASLLDRSDDEVRELIERAEACKPRRRRG